MARTIGDATSNIDAKRDELVANLVTKGVTAANTETMKDLIAKVLTVPAGIDTSDATATAADIALGKTAYVNGEKITGTMLNYRVVINLAPLTVPTIPTETVATT